MFPDKQHCFLVVDDDKDALALIELVINSGLGLKSTKVIGAANSDEAKFQLFEAKIPFSMVIIDLALNHSELDGLGLIKLIRNSPLTTKYLCVAITAFHSTAVRHEAIKAGFNAYFTKPIVNSTTFGRELSRILLNS